jgi:hypothetical protein
LFFSQIEFCDNLIFHRRAALDKLGARLLDANRTIGQPNKITAVQAELATAIAQQAELDRAFDTPSRRRKSSCRKMGPR